MNCRGIKNERSGAIWEQTRRRNGGVGAIVLVHAAHPEALRDSPAFAFARAFAYTLVNVYAIRMAGVFMLVTSTIALRTAFVARWLAVPGFAMGLFLLFASPWVDWSFIVFPLWALLISVYLLVTSLTREAASAR